MAGYTRQDTTGQLANGNPIDADIFNDEYDAIEGAFNASTGHNHDGTTGGGAPIESIGPSQELEVTSAAVFPKVDNLIDNGKSTLQWKTGYYGTDVIVGRDVTVTRDVSIGGDLTVTGDATISGNLTFGDAATDTIDFQADIDSDITPETTGTYNLGTSTQEWNNLWLDGTANVDFLTVDEDATVTGDLAVTGATGIDGDFDINTNKVTIAAATGNTSIAGTLGVADVVSVTDTTGSTGTGTGAVVVSGGVGIAENLNVGGTLDVTGDTTISGNIEATGTADITGAMGVDGNFDVATNKFTVAAATGNTAIAGTLDVTGNQTNTGDLTVNGNTTLGDADSDTITLTGVVNTNIIPSPAGTENLGSLANQWNNLWIDGTASIDTLAVDENASVAGSLSVTGDTTITGTATLSSTLDVSGATGIDGDFDVATNKFTVASSTGNTTVAGTLNVNGATTLTGAVTATGGITGNIDGIIGGTTAAAGTFTTMEFSTSISDGTRIITGFVDEDDMSSNSSSLIPTQQSVKSYVDSAVAGDGSGEISASSVDATDLSVAADTGGMDLNGGDGTGWVIYQSGTDLKFKYNGVDKFSLSTAGALTVEDNVTAYGSA